MAEQALELAGEVLARDPLERPGELIVPLGVPLDHGDGHPQGAAVDGRGAYDLLPS